MFTGDRSGDWLYDALHAAGFANRPQSVRRRDGLRLRDVRVTAAVRCAPPENLPTPAEMRRCRGYLRREIALLGPRLRVAVALGEVALRGFLQALNPGLGRPRLAFRHGAVHRLPGGLWLVTCYHPSQQNTFTRRLTRRMLRGVFRTARRLLDAGAPPRRAATRDAAEPPTAGVPSGAYRVSHTRLWRSTETRLETGDG
jgi:uracil-DNA glycosylase family 4